MPAKVLIQPGTKFGKWTVLCELPERSKSKKILYLCRCGCGAEVPVANGNLLSGKSTGCLNCRPPRIIHGQARKLGGHSRTYRIWAGMMTRCYNSSHHSFRHYGAKGIRVAEKWHTFEGFYDDMGDCPDGLTLDRFPNRNGNYEARNCRWATYKEQAENKDSIINVVLNGQEMCLSDAARKLEIGLGNLIRYRDRNNVTLQEAVDLYAKYQKVNARLRRIPRVHPGNASHEAT